MNITLKSVSPELHHRLREVAERSGRSVNKLILHTLEQALHPRKVDRARLPGRIKRRREGMEIWLDDEFLRNAIHEGRR